MVRLATALLLSASLVGGCATDTSSRDAHRLVSRGALLVDVRSPAEYRERHAPGAVNIPVERLAQMIPTLAPKGRPIVIYCHTGFRAGAATMSLRKAGYEVHNLGSIARWYKDPEGAQPF